jgi:hypothetical protein
VSFRASKDFSFSILTAVTKWVECWSGFISASS